MFKCKKCGKEQVACEEVKALICKECEDYVCRGCKNPCNSKGEIEEIENKNKEPVKMVKVYSVNVENLNKAKAKLKDVIELIENDDKQTCFGCQDEDGNEICDGDMCDCPCHTIIEDKVEL